MRRYSHLEIIAKAKVAPAAKNHSAEELGSRRAGEKIRLCSPFDKLRTQLAPLSLCSRCTARTTNHADNVAQNSAGISAMMTTEERMGWPAMVIIRAAKMPS